MEGKPMLNHHRIAAPHCTTCEELMVWINEQIVDGKQMQIFQCVICEKMKAVLLPSAVSPSDVAAHNASKVDAAAG
jgi:hypothetical protein